MRQVIGWFRNSCLDPHTLFRRKPQDHPEYFVTCSQRFTLVILKKERSANKQTFPADLQLINDTLSA
jgi:hypothetical protein